MSMGCWILTSEGMMWANGHWQSSGNGSGERTWDGEGSLVPQGYYFSPFYAAFSNGQPLLKTDVTKLSFSASIDPNIEIAKIDVDVRPYIPRITDGYYEWDESVQGQQLPLQWIADDNGCVIRFWDYNGLTYTDVATIPGSTDFSEQTFDLIKPDYDFYVVRGLKTNVGYSYNLEAVYNDISTGKIKYDISAKMNPAGVSNLSGYYHGMYGDFGDYGAGATILTGAPMSSFVLGYNNGFITYPVADRTKFITGGTPRRSPDSQRSWSGTQRPSIWHTGAVNSRSIPNGPYLLPGFKYPTGATMEMVEPVEGGDYRYAALWVLKKLTKMTGTIVG